MRYRILLFVAVLLGAVLVMPVTAQADTYYMDNNTRCVRTTMPVTIHVDGEYLYTEDPPVIQNGRTMVPLRSAGEAIGAEVNWDQTTKTASASINGRSVRFTLNSTTYYVDGVAKTADVAPMLINNRTMLPIRAFGEGLGVKVDWDQSIYDVKIDTSAPNFIPELPNGVYTSDFHQMLQKYYVQPTSDSNVSGSYISYWWDDKSTIEGAPEDSAIFVTPIKVDGRTKVHVVTVDVIKYSYRNTPDITVVESIGDMMGDSGFTIKYTDPVFRQGAAGNFVKLEMMDWYMKMGTGLQRYWTKATSAPGNGASVDDPIFNKF